MWLGLGFKVCKTDSVKVMGVDRPWHCQHLLQSHDTVNIIYLVANSICLKATLIPQRKLTTNRNSSWDHFVPLDCRHSLTYSTVRNWLPHRLVCRQHTWFSPGDKAENECWLLGAHHLHHSSFREVSARQVRSPNLEARPKS